MNNMGIEDGRSIAKDIDEAICGCGYSAEQINLLACAVAEAICKNKKNEHLKLVIHFLQILIGLIKTYE